MNAPFAVGDILEMASDCYMGSPYNAYPGDLARLTAISNQTKTKGDPHWHCQVTWLTGTATHEGPWSHQHFKRGSMNPFACRKCGATDCFIELWKAVNHSTITYIDADTGHIEWTGASELGDSVEHICYECTNCNTQYSKADFDPRERIAAMLTDLNDLLGEEDDNDE